MYIRCTMVSGMWIKNLGVYRLSKCYRRINMIELVENVEIPAAVLPTTLLINRAFVLDLSCACSIWIICWHWESDR